MVRRIVMIAALWLALTPGASAQEAAAVLHTIPVPLQSPEIVLSPDGTTLAAFENAIIVDYEVTAETLPIYLIDAAQGVLIGTLDGEQTDLTRDVAFSPDGSQLVSSQHNGDLIVWDVATRSAVQSFDWLPLGGAMVDYLPDGNTVAMMFSNGFMGQQLLFDLTTGSITDMLRLRPPTFAALQEEVGDMSQMGKYGVVSQVAGTPGALYGATPDGEVFVWDLAARTRTTLAPSAAQGPMRFPVRKIEQLSDGTLFFYDNELDATIRLAPDGTRTDFPLGSPSFAVSEAGLLAFIAPDDDLLYVADLTAESPAAQPVALDLGEEVSLSGRPSLTFMPDGKVIIGALLNSDTDNAVYVLELA